MFITFTICKYRCNYLYVSKLIINVCLFIASELIFQVNKYSWVNCKGWGELDICRLSLMCQGYDDHIYRYRFLPYYFERSIDILIFISLLFMLLAFMSFKLKIFNLFTGHLNWNINILFQMKYSQKPPIPPPAKKEKKKFSYFIMLMPF